MRAHGWSRKRAPWIVLAGLRIRECKDIILHPSDGGNPDGEIVERAPAIGRGKSDRVRYFGMEGPAEAQREGPRGAQSAPAIGRRKPDRVRYFGMGEPSEAQREGRPQGGLAV